MTIKEEVCALLDAPPVLRTDLVDTIVVQQAAEPEPEPTGDEFRAFLAEHRGEQSTRGRVASRVLRMGHGAVPSKAGVRELIRLRLNWVPAAWCALYQEFTGEFIAIADLMPSETELPKLVPSPAPKKREPRQFIGVYPTPSGKWMAFIKVGDRGKSLGVFSDPHLAAMKYDEFTRVTPLESGQPRKLNFMIDDPLACTPEPNTFHLKAA